MSEKPVAPERLWAVTPINQYTGRPRLKGEYTCRADDYPEGVAVEYIRADLAAGMPSEEWLKEADHAIQQLCEAVHYDALFFDAEETAKAPAWRARLHHHLRERIQP